MSGLMLEVGQGLQYIHSQKIVHRDIACRNILVDARQPDYIQTYKFFHAKIGDFGLAKGYNNDEFIANHPDRLPGFETPTTSMEVLPWMIFSPEIFMEFSSLNPQSAPSLCFKS